MTAFHFDIIEDARTDIVIERGPRYAGYREPVVYVVHDGDSFYGYDTGREFTPFEYVTPDAALAGALDFYLDRLREMGEDAGPDALVAMEVVLTGGVVRPWRERDTLEPFGGTTADEQVPDRAPER